MTEPMDTYTLPTELDGYREAIQYLETAEQPDPTVAYALTDADTDGASQTVWDVWPVFGDGAATMRQVFDPRQYRGRDQFVDAVDAWFDHWEESYDALDQKRSYLADIADDLDGAYTSEIQQWAAAVDRARDTLETVITLPADTADEIQNVLGVPLDEQGLEALNDQQRYTVSIHHRNRFTQQLLDEQVWCLSPPAPSQELTDAVRDTLLYTATEQAREQGHDIALPDPATDSEPSAASDTSDAASPWEQYGITDTAEQDYLSALASFDADMHTTDVTADLLRDIIDWAVQENTDALPYELRTDDRLVTAAQKLKRNPGLYDGNAPGTRGSRNRTVATVRHIDDHEAGQ